MDLKKDEVCQRTFSTLRYEVEMKGDAMEGRWRWLGLEQGH